MSLTFWSASRRVFDLSLGEMLWSRRTIFMALVVGGPVLLALIVRALVSFGLTPLRVDEHHEQLGLDLSQHGESISLFEAG